jgi:AcrR family transcriptional regulator
MLRAVTELVAEAGLTRTTVTGVCRRAGVAPNAFYVHFATKQECYLAAYDDFVAEILDAVAAVMNPGQATAANRPTAGKQEEGAGWERLITEGLAAYLGLLDARPTEARAFVLQVDSAGPAARDHLRRTLNAMAQMLHRRHLALRTQNPGLGALPDAVYLGLVHGIRALVCESMLRDPGRPLLKMLPDLALWISSTVTGAPGARETPPSRPGARDC